jgi:hypothetical protein
MRLLSISTTLITLTLLALFFAASSQAKTWKEGQTVSYKVSPSSKIHYNVTFKVPKIAGKVVTFSYIPASKGKKARVMWKDNKGLTSSSSVYDYAIGATVEDALYTSLPLQEGLELLEQGKAKKPGLWAAVIDPVVDTDKKWAEFVIMSSAISKTGSPDNTYYGVRINAWVVGYDNAKAIASGLALQRLVK